MRSLIGLGVAIAMLGLAQGNALAAGGELTQKTGTAACVSESGTGGLCQDGKALEDAAGVATSPDGKSVYVASREGGSIGGAVAIFDRNTTSGALTQKAGTAGCVSDDGSGGACAQGNALFGATDVTVSPDGKSVYVAAAVGLVIFDRDIASGALTQKSGQAGCVVNGDGGSECASGKALRFLRRVVVSPDGKSVYVVANGSKAVAIFDRNTASGALTQKSGVAGCVSNDGTDGDEDNPVGGACQDGRSLESVSDIAISPDGQSVYVSARSAGIAIFDRDTTTGALTQMAGAEGCIEEDGLDGCREGRRVAPRAITVSPDGQSVYAAGGSETIILDRAGSGELTQKAGVAGCISEFGGGGSAVGCEFARAMDDPTAVAVSPDGSSVYVTSDNSGEIAIFDRYPTTGGLVQKPGTAGCIAQEGEDGCQSETAIAGATDIAVSADGNSAYVSSTAFTEGNAVAIFDRAPSVDATADLSLSVSDSPDPITYGGLLTYTITVDNLGPDPADGVKITNVLPESVQPLESFDCFEFLKTMTCDIDTIASGGSESIEIQVSPEQAGAITNSASVISTAADPAAANNSVSTGTTVAEPAGEKVLRVVKNSIGEGGFDGGSVAESAPVPDMRIDCGFTCTAAYDEGAVVTLIATPGSFHTFTGWSGGGCSGTGDCTVTLDASKTVTATFTQMPNTLTITKEGAGQGTVTSTPAGINCGSDCEEEYAFGTDVVLTATPAAGSTFDGFDGAGCAGPAPCTVSNIFSHEIVATFSPASSSQRTLTVTKSGAGQGTVTSTPAGINCGADCTEDYDDGATVTLTASASAGSTFATFTGSGCSASPCTVTMDAAKTVDAAFGLEGSDTTPPETEITKGPPKRTKQSKAKFEFEGTDDVSPSASLTFECKLDSGDFKPCTSPHKLKNLKKGKHKLEVQASDEAGNTDLTPDKHRWKVKK